MYKKIIITSLIFIALLVSCSSTHQLRIYDGPATVRLVDFCKIDKCYDGEFIRTTATYTKVEEYWGLKPNTNCKLDHPIYLNTAELNKKLLKEFDKLHKNYKDYSLKLKITGKIEMSKETTEDGNLESKKTQIIPYYIEILEKQELTMRK